MDIQDLKEEFKYNREQVRGDLNSLYELHSEQLKKNDDHLKLLIEIKEQVLKTNGRVNRLESDCEKIMKETEVVRVIGKRPKLLNLLIIGYIVATLGTIAGLIPHKTLYNHQGSMLL